ncbi:unnamed protein product [Porites lobata]|uniref:BTB domain-containing protein n=1 Tax=Porites lobata TaxID=104759 RepID=A0ABN8QL05_9CNID|nr:unnamed protein product [Porites lobata]
MFLIEDSSWEPIKETDKQRFCMEMMNRLDIQRKKGQFCDVVLEVCNGEDQARFNAHRVVLCAGSPFFYSALNNDMKESKEGLIRLEDMSKVAIEELLDYLYTGHVDVTQHNAFDLLKIADFLVIPSLKEVSSKFIIHSLSSSNCFMAYYLAVNYRCFELQEKARDFIYANFTRVVEHEDFLNLTINEVEEWISSDEIRVRGEEDVFQAIVKWAEQKGSGEREKFFELFRHVRLMYLSRNYVLNDILPHPLITNEKACTAFVLDTIKHVSCGSEECFFAQAPRNCLKTAEDCLVLSGVTKTLCYVAHEDKWYQMADKTKSRYLYSASAYHGKLYINHGTGVDYAIERFDPAVNSWAPLTSYSGEMSHFFAAVVYFQGFLYVIGGKQNGEVANCVHKYSPDTNLWQEVAAMNVSRFSPSAVADEDTIYAIGGQKNDQILDVVERFDSKMNSWCRVASMLEKKLLPCVAILNAKVFLFGGYTSIHPPHVCSSIEMYDPTSNMWTAIQGISAPTRFFGVTSFKGSVYVIGRQTQESPGSLFLQIYDVEKNEWKRCSSVPVISTAIALVPLRIPRDILNTCKVVT